jgi:FtsP/CotA-like multicopper oxidase with cupredoxin domain
MDKRKFLILISLVMTVIALSWGVEQAQAVPVLTPGVDYTKPNFAYSPPLRKFINNLPGIGAANNLGQQIPLAVADTATFPGSDYYEIALVEYNERMHGDLPVAGTKLRGYVQEHNGVPVAVGPHYLGPLILATKDRPVRIKFTNRLPTGAGGNLFLPVDGTIMGAGEGPKFANGTDCDPATQACANYTENRATIHLHGGLPPWISDGTAHQWITPAGEATPYVKGASQQNVPDMWFLANGNVIAACAGQLTCGTAGATTSPAGVATFYWPNQMSGRLLFYHDHALGLTGLNVYAGEAAGYLLVDPAEENALAAAGVPGTVGTVPDLAHLIPLVIQDKTFVYDNSVTPVGVAKDPTRFTAATDPLWTWGAGGNLWFPHVYIPNQDPTDLLTGANPLGRWDYGPWFWPVFPVASPYPPIVSHVPEAFMDTPLVNGTAYPYVDVAPAKYRLRILNAMNDRMVNLQFYQADPTITPFDPATGQPNPGYLKEVKMVPAVPNPAIPFPPVWLTQTPGMIPDILDSRPSGVPDPTLRGPAMIQIGTEGGLMPAPALLPNTPVGFEQNKRNIVVLNVLEKTLFMAPAERADVIVDFTNFAGKTLILYNDSPAPVPAGDPRYDFYTGNLDNTSQGGAPSTIAGYGPNTRTIMQFRVSGTGGTAPVDDYPAALLTSLNTNLPAIFATTQDKIIVPEPAYPVASGANSATATYSLISDTSLTFTPLGSAAPVTKHLLSKAIQELFDPEGRMNATLGVELPFTGALIQTTVPLGFLDPTTETIGPNEIQLWKITHNGVDTHGIHFHLVNVQVINRVGWDGAIRLPDPNELGWKDTVRMNPLEDIVVAMRAKVSTYPFAVPNSIRPLAPALPVGSTFASLDPLTGQPITVTNAITNFGHEYTWHCHILGHEENDMMRPFVLNPNAMTEILWSNFSNGQNVIWNMDGMGVTNISVLPSIADPAWKIVGRGDFNSDGKRDLFWRNTSTGQNAVWYMDGVNATGLAIIDSLAAPWIPVGVGDFNYDGKADIVWRNTSTGENAIWLMNGVTVSSLVVLPSLSDQAWTFAAIGDLNVDGKPDIIWRNTTTGQNVVWYMNGATVSGTDFINAEPDLTWAIVDAGDFNADVKPDIVWRNTSTGQNRVWFMDGVALTGTGSLDPVPDLNWKIVHN